MSVDIWPRGRDRTKEGKRGRKKKVYSTQSGYRILGSAAADTPSFRYRDTYTEVKFPSFFFSLFSLLPYFFVCMLQLRMNGGLKMVIGCD